MIDVPDFCESDSDVKEPQNKRKKPPIHKTWKYECTFATDNEAQDFIRAELCWSLKNTNHTEQGMIKYYRCNKVKSRGAQCQSGLKLIYDSSSHEVILHRLEGGHNCDTIETKACTGMTMEVKLDIEDLFRKKFKPKAILDSLTEKYANPPNLNQVRNYLAQLKKAIYVPSSISLGELENWLNSHKNIPADNHTPFVVNYLTDISDNGNFRFMVSSKSLLKFVLNEDTVIHADTTYKLIWQGFSVLLIGTTDCNRKFHLLGLAVCKNEEIDDFDFIFRSLKEAVQTIYNFEFRPKVLIADASHSITSGFKNVFGEEVTIRMCWVHMRKAVQKKVQTLAEKSNVNQILIDIDAVQLSENKDEFFKVYKLFVTKWQNESQFLQYFQEKWFDKNQNWYEGACPGTISTNNGLESTKRVLKDEDTFREKLPLSQFCYVLMDMIEKLSRKYENNSEKFSDEIHFDLKTWTSAYQWARLNKKIDTVDNASERKYLVPAGEYNEVIKANLVEETNDNFDEYIKKKSSYYKLSLPTENEKWKDGRCTCPNFFKNYICKHLLGIAIRFKYINPPLEVKETGIKRKRGRPSKAEKVLIVQ